MVFVFQNIEKLHVFYTIILLCNAHDGISRIRYIIQYQSAQPSNLAVFQSSFSLIAISPFL